MAKNIKTYRNKTERYEDKGQSFDRENIFIIKKGQKINVYDMIQAGREDTEIYPMLEKYGCIKTNKELNKPLLYGDFEELQDLRDIQEKMQLADNLWQRLDLETRKKYGHNKMAFINDPTKYLEKPKEQILPTTNEQQKVEETK